MNQSATTLRAKLRFASACQAARKAFDLTQFGRGPAERMVSSLILAAWFFLVALVVAFLLALPARYAVGFAGLALLSAVASAAILILWHPDDADLERVRIAAAAELPAALAAEREQLRRERSQAEEDAADEVEAMRVRSARKPERERRPASRESECGYCGGAVPVTAVKCRHCGEFFDEDMRRESARPERTTIVINDRRRRNGSPAVAMLISVFFPGWGHIYRGRFFGGLVIWFMLPLAYLCCLFPGVLLHFLVIFDSAAEA